MDRPKTVSEVGIHSGVKIAISSEQGVYTRFEPVNNPAPLVIDVSRSGRCYPVDFRPDAPMRAVHSQISMYVDELMIRTPEMGATLLRADFPVTVIDTNRGRDDIDPELFEGELPFAINPTDRSLKNGAGLIHSRGAKKIPLYENKLTAAQIIDRITRYYDPYHAELERLLKVTKAGNRNAYHISVHCMSSVDPKNPDGANARRPDICLGDLDGATCDPKFRDFVADSFKKLGHEVAINAPFRGGQLIGRYSDPASGQHSLQIELCKRLFMKEKDGTRNEKFERFQSDLAEVIRDIRTYIDADRK